MTYVTFHSLLTFLLAASEPLTKVLFSFPFWFSLNSVTIPKLNSLICSIVSCGYWQPINSMLPNVCAKPTWTRSSLKILQMLTSPYQNILWEPVLMMFHEFLLQLPVVGWLMWRPVLANVPVLRVAHGVWLPILSVITSTINYHIKYDYTILI